MSLQADPLEKYRKKQSSEPSTPTENELEDPLSKYRKNEPKRKKDFLLDQLAEVGTLEQKVLAEQRRNEGEFGRGVVSGSTFGLSEGVPGLETEGGGFSTAGDIAGSVTLPIGTAIKGAKLALTPVMKLAQNSPKIRKGIESLGRLTGVGAVGAATTAGHEATEGGKWKVPSIENALEQGAIWSSIDVGLGAIGKLGKFVKTLASKSKELGKDKYTLLNEVGKELSTYGGSDEKVAQKALDILESKTGKESSEIARQVEERREAFKNRKIEVQDFSKIEHVAPEPYLPNEFSSETIAEKMIDDDLNQSLDAISERASSEKSLGENIQKDIESSIGEKKAETDALYAEAGEGQELKNVNLQKTANSIVEQLKILQSGNLKLSPEGYAKAEKQLLQALEDIGYHVNVDEATQVSQALKVKDVNLKDAVEIKRRLNNIIDYDLKETSAQRFLKDPAFSMRKDIREGYGSKDSAQRKAYEKAEELFGQNAEKQKRKSIVSARYSEKPEQIAKLIKTPSGLSDIKNIVSENQFKQIERELLEHIKSLPEDKARNFYREVRSDLSQDAKILGEQLIEAKAPSSSPDRKALQRQKIQDAFLDDIAQSTITGQRPKKALDLWKTKEGQKLIKHSLQDNPNKKQVLKYLQDTSFNDFASSVVNKEGKVDFNKLNELLKDPATIDNIRMVAGEEGVQFLKQLKTLSEKAKKNFSMIEGIADKGSEKQRASLDKSLNARFGEKVSRHKEGQEKIKKGKLIYKFDDFIKSYGIKTKGLLGALGIINIGTLPTLAAGATIETIKYAAKNKSIRKAVREAAKYKNDPELVLKSLDALDKATKD